MNRMPAGGKATSVSVHEHALRLAIAEARGNPTFPFGAVIESAQR
jgi:hypothetical protein